VLEIVEYQQQVLVLEIRRQAVCHAVFGYLSQRQHRPDCNDAAVVGHMRQLHMGEPPIEQLCQVIGDLDCHARLADATRASQRDESHLWAADECRYRVDLMPTTSRSGVAG
jgi:hypothetical protein